MKSPFQQAARAGFSIIELLVALGLFSVILLATGRLVSISGTVIRDQQLDMEVTQAARATLGMLTRELRLGGACLPVTGRFVSLDGQNDGNSDEVVTRTGLVGNDLTCVQTTASAALQQEDTALVVESVQGIEPDMRVYVRNTAGDGTFFTVTSVDEENSVLGHNSPLPNGLSDVDLGVYAIDERRFFIEQPADDSNDPPRLMMQLGEEDPVPFASGIEELNVEYQLRRNCPPCDVVDLPAGNEEWSLVEKIILTVTARSERRTSDGNFIERTISVDIKPRNLIPGTGDLEDASNG